jgi:hypothetical protein
MIWVAKTSFPPEKSALDGLVDVSDLLGGEIGAPKTMSGLAMRPGMLFRPEENALLSKSLDDVRMFQPVKIHLGNKDDGSRPAIQASAMHVVIDFQIHRFPAVRAGRFHPNSHRLLPQAPLHEGRCKSIHRSGGVQLFPGGKGYAVGGFFNRHRIGPGDLPVFVPV